MSQCFSINVPNTDVTIAGGSGAVEGISLTTGNDVFAFAGVELVLESAADMRVQTTGSLGVAATGGILIGTPATIQHSAGGGVQIYAGAAVSAGIGGPGGPGAPMEASQPVDTGAGQLADRLNAFNDTAKGLSDVYSGVTGFQEASNAVGGPNAMGQIAGAFGAAKGAWSAANGVTNMAGGAGEGSTWGSVLAGGNEVFKYAGVGVAGAGVANSFESGDNVGGTTGAIGLAATLTGMVVGEINKANAEDVKADYGAKLAAAQEAAAAKMVCGVPGATVVPPADGPRIHEVAPANIDRECGGSMTAKVGADKTATVDGSIKYKAGGSVSIKAFAAVSTQSLTFSAHANVAASMKGLASAKVDSLGSASMTGRAKVTVSSTGPAKVEGKAKLDLVSAGKVTVDAGAVLAMKAGGAATLHAADVGIVAKGQASIKAPTVHLRGDTVIHKTLSVKKKVEVDNSIFARARIKSRAKIENPHFKAG